MPREVNEMMELELIFNPEVSYIQYQNRMDVLLKASALNDGVPRDYVRFRITSSPRFFDDVECRCQCIQPMASVDVLSLPDLSLNLDPGFISSISEAAVCRVTFSALDRDGNTIGETSADVRVQPFDYWPGINMAETVASFITPNADSLSGIRSKASDILGEWGRSR